jgi:hypothetical protein
MSYLRPLPPPPGALLADLLCDVIVCRAAAGVTRGTTRVIRGGMQVNTGGAADGLR